MSVDLLEIPLISIPGKHLKAILSYAINEQTSAVFIAIFVPFMCERILNSQNGIPTKYTFQQNSKLLSINCYQLICTHKTALLSVINSKRDTSRDATVTLEFSDAIVQIPH